MVKATQAEKNLSFKELFVKVTNKANNKAQARAPRAPTAKISITPTSPTKIPFFFLFVKPSYKQAHV